jgi:hypothetical protein
MGNCIALFAEYDSMEDRAVNFLDWSGMSAFSLPVTRPTGRGLLIGRQGSREGCAAAIRRLGFTLEERDDPYSAMAEIARNSASYSAVFVMLGGLFKQEFSIIPAIKTRYGHVEIWLAQTDGRQSAMGEAMQLGADGLLTDEGLHRLVAAEREQAEPPADPAPVRSELVQSEPAVAQMTQTKNAPQENSAGQIAAGLSQLNQGGFAEPILTADELRALLQEPPLVVRTADE